MNDLSIIILSYNTKEITDRCLSKLKEAVEFCHKNLGNEIEVWVLDNASIDDSVNMIKKKHTWVKLIESKSNLGYSGGNNLVLKKISYPYILFLNSDAFVEQDTLKNALEFFQKNPECSVLGPKFLYENGKLQPSAGNLPNPINTIFWILGISYIPGIGRFTNPFHTIDKSFFSYIHPVGWTTGAFFMVKKEVLEKVGGFDEHIFMYMDEVDLCKRISDVGYKICINPEIKVTHIHRASSQDDPERAITLELKGIKYFLNKYYSSAYFLVRLFLILGLILRIMAFSLLGKTKRARAYVEGLKVI